MSRVGTNRYDKMVMAFRKRITWQEFRGFVYNWKRYKRYERGQFYMDFHEDDELANVIELTLFCMLAAGEITCIEIEAEKPADPEPEPDNTDILKEIEANQKKRDTGPYQFLKAI